MVNGGCEGTGMNVEENSSAHNPFSGALPALVYNLQKHKDPHSR